MILAEDLKWLIDRWPSLVNEIVNALLAGYQFRSLSMGGYCRRADVNFPNDAITPPAAEGFDSPTSGGCWCAPEVAPPLRPKSML